MTHQEILDAMGSAASDGEADAMAEILKERGIDDLGDINDEEFFALIPEAIKRAELECESIDEARDRAEFALKVRAAQYQEKTK